MADGVNGGGGGDGGSASRPHRLPRWTRREIMVLIEAKRAAEGRGRGARGPRSAAGETKWEWVSAYCRRKGVDRGMLQCRKRWSNLACDFKKVRAWEGGEGAAAGESFWAMRNDCRRDRRLPGFFDKEVFDILNWTVLNELEAEEEEEEAEVKVRDGGEGENEKDKDEVEVEEEEAVFDSGRTAADNGLFSDCEHENGMDGQERLPPPIAVTPISERKFEPFQQEFSDPGIVNDRQPANDHETQSSQGLKRRRISPEEGSSNFDNQLIKIIERNNKMIVSHFNAQNANLQLERDQWREQANSLLDVLNKLVDAVGRIADKL
ncbi:trihelix transcription factor ASR3 [Musa acuminata AAA Group]|uniref:trihelix transcription factor ASR3 n=1 Tax=Musa acuminata AAA Group TaxID=214697 RepID=UPI0031CEA977